VGEKGITLSGGQKARLALARAINADADILILDDPFSAVDSKVGKMIYQNLMTKMKGLKTIVLATHHVQYFEGCDEIVYLKDGEI
jgi:ATP-binding cassette, subfamily C (CFTR/MRP), member 4